VNKNFYNFKKKKQNKSKARVMSAQENLLSPAIIVEFGALHTKAILSGVDGHFPNGPSASFPSRFYTVKSAGEVQANNNYQHESYAPNSRYRAVCKFRNLVHDNGLLVVHEAEGEASESKRKLTARTLVDYTIRELENSVNDGALAVDSCSTFITVEPIAAAIAQQHNSDYLAFQKQRELIAEVAFETLYTVQNVANVNSAISTAYSYGIDPCIDYQQLQQYPHREQDMNLSFVVCDFGHGEARCVEVLPPTFSLFNSSGSNSARASFAKINPMSFKKWNNSGSMGRDLITHVEQVYENEFDSRVRMEEARKAVLNRHRLIVLEDLHIDTKTTVDCTQASRQAEMEKLTTYQGVEYKQNYAIPELVLFTDMQLNASYDYKQALQDTCEDMKSSKVNPLLFAKKPISVNSTTSSNGEMDNTHCRGSLIYEMAHHIHTNCYHSNSSSSHILKRQQDQAKQQQQQIIGNGGIIALQGLQKRVSKTVPLLNNKQTKNLQWYEPHAALVGADMMYQYMDRKVFEQEFCITRHQYDEYGPSIVHSKAKQFEMNCVESSCVIPSMPSPLLFEQQQKHQQQSSKNITIQFSK